jgi:hypothetical protein
LEAARTRKSKRKIRGFDVPAICVRLEVGGSPAMNIEIPASAELQAINNAAAAGFTDVSEYVVNLIMADGGGVPEEALSDPYYEELVIAGLNSGTPTPMEADYFEKIRKRLLENRRTNS